MSSHAKLQPNPKSTLTPEEKAKIHKLVEGYEETLIALGKK
jgi:hypothetical protein